ncbi:O-antigen ligase family protein [Limibaculum sp. FT325]|uniref:O-antigen ligase family protein n=1 Tax=Thermohalobaculum sediminis TaxID=2939436 RepID=UPI0020C0E5DE|nr:O-antigen ligase family protein [Limibaculum sediminis]MCL5777892.1 O-antigen ligase family protein [Limibaculum sediminis]
MWSAIVISMSFFYTALVVRTASRAQDRHLAFVIVALGSRYLISAFSSATNTPVVGGLSAIALSSVAISALGLLIVDKRLLSLRALLPFYIFVFFVAFSGIANGKFITLFMVFTKFIYLVTIQLALFHALESLGPRRVFSTLLLVFTMPAGLQAISVLLGLDSRALGVTQRLSAGELNPQDINFIGPYGHESGFSMILLTMLVCVAFWRSRYGAAFWVLLAATILGIMFANYRTTILAAGPILLVIIFVRSAKIFAAGQRGFWVTLSVLAAIAASIVVLGPSELVTRFSDLIAIDLANFSRSPNMLTEAERDLLSARLYIWSQYLSAFREADIANQLIGFGPESWQGVFVLYAHNTFISYLYEFGYLGLIAFLVFWIGNFAMCLAIKDAGLCMLMLSIYAGFTILNLATMPIWQVEGLICFAVMNGCLLHYSRRTVGHRGLVDENLKGRAKSSRAASATIVLDLDQGRDASRG